MALITGIVAFVLLIVLIDIVMRRIFHVDMRGRIETLMSYHNYDMDATLDGTPQKQQLKLQKKEKVLMCFLSGSIVILAIITYVLI